MPELERVQQNTPITWQHQWRESGVAVDPGTVTVGITRWDGTELVPPGTTTGGTGTAARTFNFTAVHTVLLERFKVTATSTLKGTLWSFVEVVGGFLFRVDEAQARPSLASVLVPNIEVARIRAEQYLERRCGMRAFVPRYMREAVDGNRPLVVNRPGVRAIRSGSDSGTVLSGSQIAALTFSGSIIDGYYWASGYGNVTIGYEYGDDFPEEPVRAATLDLAESYLTAVSQQQGIDPRTTQIRTPEGTIDFGADVRSVDQVVRDYDLSLFVA